MSNGYLVAAAADAATAREIGDGFGLDVIEADTIGDTEAVAHALASAANVGLMLSSAAAADAVYVALLQALAGRLQRAQLILVEPGARAQFAFLPAAWPAMPLEEARTRASVMARQRQEAADAPRAQPLPPTAPETPAPDTAPSPAEQDAETNPHQPTNEELSGGDDAKDETGAAAPGRDLDERALDTQVEEEARQDTLSTETHDAANEQPAIVDAPAPVAPKPAPSVNEPPAPQAASPNEPAPARKRSAPPAGAVAATAPADATAFAPRKLRRGTPELVRVAVHQPKDLQAVIRAARKIDPRAEAAPQGMSIGEVALGSSIGVALEVRGGVSDGALQRRTWTGEPIDFSFSVEAGETVKQVVLLARVFVDDAQIGVLAFTRNVSGPAKNPHSTGDRVRLKRHKRVFLSYSSRDRETVSAIATAYQSAGVEHFWDRASLKSGEEWHPRLRREIDRADLFHLCWSRSAADSEWVKKETEYALTRRRRNSGRPDITVQMLDGPPWAPHPPELDAINFDDFVRAAIVGYARGDSGE